MSARKRNRRPARPPRPASLTRRRPPGLEPLEERTLLAVAVFASADVPRAIPDEDTVPSALVVDQSFLVGDVDVTLDIDHTYDGDLDVTLMAPDGTVVELFSDVGEDGDGFDGTTLDDEADESVFAAEAPFAGAFRPAGSLADFDGIN